MEGVNHAVLCFGYPCVWTKPNEGFKASDFRDSSARAEMGDLLPFLRRDKRMRLVVQKAANEAIVVAESERGRCTPSASASHVLDVDHVDAMPIESRFELVEIDELVGPVGNFQISRFAGVGVEFDDRAS